MQSVVLVRKRAERFDVECVVHANGCRNGLPVRREGESKQDLGLSVCALTRFCALRRRDEAAIRRQQPHLYAGLYRLGNSTSLGKDDLQSAMIGANGPDNSGNLA